MRKPIVTLVALVLLAGCGGRSGSDPEASGSQTPRTDAAGNPIAPGDDWSGAGEATRDDAGSKGGSGGQTDEAAQTEGSVVCVPPTAPPEVQEEIESLPPDQQEIAKNPFPPPNNDFPMEASVSPKKAAPGDELTIDVLAVGQKEALVVILPSFSDGEHHGMRATKFTDATGHAVLKGPVPEDAPEGLVQVAVSVSTRDQRSAVQNLQFTVTGEHCT